MTRLWQRWVDFTGRPTDSRPLALVRILMPLCVIADLARVAQLGLVRTLFVPYAQGGLSRVQDDAWWLDDWLGPERAGPVSYVVTLVCMLCISLGVAMRPAILLGVWFYAQLGHAYPPGDRAIDRLVRMVLLFLLFSQADRRFSLPGALGFRRAVQMIAAWPADLIRYALLIVYLSAGVSKLMQQPRWLAVEGTPVLYRVLTDPLAANLDSVFWARYPLPFFIGSWGTIIMELGAFAILTRWAPYWAVLGVGMHIGIALGMKLGMFSWGMLSTYPILLAPWICAALDALSRRGGGWAALGAKAAEPALPVTDRSATTSGA